MTTELLVHQLTPGVQVIVEGTELGVVDFNSIIGLFSNDEDIKNWRDLERGVMISLRSGATVFFPESHFIDEAITIPVEISE